MARPARAAPRTLWLLALAGLALPLGQAAVGSEGGAGAGRVGGMRGGATRALSAVTPQPGGAAESPRRLGTSWLTYLYHGDEQYPEMSSCQGREKEVSRCDSLPSCEAVCKPMDCKFSDWGSWLSMGGCVGLCQRTRDVDVPSNICGRPCDGATVETASGPECLPSECPKVLEKQDCLWGDWSEWNECEGRSMAQAFRVRGVEHMEQLGGTPCSGSFNETKPCTVALKADCRLSEWTDWTDCSTSCGGGWRSQGRHFARRASMGGKTCTESLRQMAECNTQPCGEPAPCRMGDWDTWDGCSRDSEYQRFRSREVLLGSRFGGPACDYGVKETLACQADAPKAPPACAFTSWSAWATCSATCEGNTIRTRVLQSDLVEDDCAWGLGSSQVAEEVQPCGVHVCGSPPRKPVLDAWSAWSACSVDCGVGIRTRSRSVLRRGGDTDGESLPLSMVESCDKGSCSAVDCQWGQWDEWSGCTTSCGGGNKRRDRSVVEVQRRGGRLCDALDKSEMAVCNTKPCEACIDGRWGAWGDWSSCTATCSPAYRARHREVDQHPNLCGKPVVGLEDEFQMCELSSEDWRCDANADCALEEWAEWSSCTCACFGVRERFRQILRYARGKGRPCGEHSLKQVEPCHPGAGEEPPASCEELVRPCQTSDWGDWGVCAATCGGAQRVRKRHILAPAADGGTPCEGGLEETASCGEEPCPGPKKVCQDCLWGAWSDWDDCKRCGAPRFRRRGIETMPTACGKPCEPLPAKEVGTCSANCSRTNKAFGYCAWSPWQELASCDGPCGRATRMLQRDLGLHRTRPEAAVQLLGAGHCLDAGGRRYETLEVAAATEAACREVLRDLAGDFGVRGASYGAVDGAHTQCHVHVDKGVDPKRGAPPGIPWRGGWRFGNATGPVERGDGGEGLLCLKLDHSIFFSGGMDVPCSGSQIRFATCQENCVPECEPQDCAFGDWSEWTEPHCGGAHLCERDRAIVANSRCGGRPCEGSTVETKVCAGGCPKPLDCVFEPWGAWDESSCASCQGPGMWCLGQRIRHRGAHRATRGGEPCSGFVNETEPCVLLERKVDCAVGNWSEWSSCSRTCGGGTKSRGRAVLHGASGGGKPCDEALSELSPCHERVCDEARDCVLNAWGPWSSCSDTEYAYRRRHVLRNPHGLGAPCNGILREVRPCHRKAVDCRLAAWAPWEACDRPCGGGQQERRRETEIEAGPGGKPCVSDLAETRGCNRQRCLGLDCAVGDWTQWSACNALCGAGQRTRARHLLQLPKEGGAGCEANMSEAVACQGPGKDCLVAATDCRWGFWSEWGECSRSCGGGQRVRDRPIARMPTPGGKPCAVSNKTEMQPCHTPACRPSCADGRWGGWSDWGECSETCGPGGVSWRSREVEQEADSCGAPVTGHTTELRACENSQPCSKDVDCAFDDWSTWSQCTSKCDGIRARERTIRVQGHEGGEFCEGGLKQAAPCAPCTSNSKRHPVDCELSDWSVWTDCSATCGRGQRKRSREILNKPSGGGRPCEGSLSFVARCAAGPCVKCTQQDCSWGQWGEWAACDKCSGQRTRRRHIEARPRCGGRSCEPEMAEQVSNCTRRCGDKVFCVWEAWEEWTRCTATCGTNGHKERTRRLTTVSRLPHSAPREVISAAAAAQDYAFLEEQVDRLGRLAAAAEGKRLQVLSSAFALGCLSLAALLAVSRQVSSRAEPRRSDGYLPVMHSDSEGEEAPGGARAGPLRGLWRARAPPGPLE